MAEVVNAAWVPDRLVPVLHPPLLDVALHLGRQDVRLEQLGGDFVCEGPPALLCYH